MKLITGLFGKKDNFYLQLDEEKEAKTEAESNGKKAAAPAPVAPAPKAESTNGKAPKASAPKASAPKAEPVAAAPAKPAQPQPPADANFATKYLMSNGSNGRRRPGANMNSYLDMAREAKKPISNK